VKGNGSGTGSPGNDGLVGTVGLILRFNFTSFEYE